MYLKLLENTCELSNVVLEEKMELPKIGIQQQLFSTSVQRAF
jgi:hypothetical protein